MKERPILFSGEMVRAILEGRKTQTRRVLRVPNHPAVADWVLDSEFRATARSHSDEVARQYVTTFPHGRVRCPYGAPGDRLWVRETFAYYPDAEHVIHRADEGADLLALGCDLKGCWKPSIHMPRWASRITLEIKSVRVERVQDISEEDAKAEGCDEWIPCGVHTGLKGVRIRGAKRKGSHREYFSLLWDSINAKRGHSWESNPWVWVIEFEVLK